jgi:hypothetical protein
MEIQERVTSILKRRHEHVPLVQKAIEQWQALGQEILALDAVIEDLRSSSSAASAAGEIARFPAADISSGINASLELLHVLKARLSRDTINIGVSGRARVGKSTLLQAFSGLGDDQIPTGRGLPVTAVHSRIFHSTIHSRATLSLHSFDSFRKDVLAPYHEALALPAAPSNIAAFREFRK